MSSLTLFSNGVRSNVEVRYLNNRLILDMILTASCRFFDVIDTWNASPCVRVLDSLRIVCNCDNNKLTKYECFLNEYLSNSNKKNTNHYTNLKVKLIGQEDPDVINLIKWLLSELR